MRRTHLYLLALLALFLMPLSVRAADNEPFRALHQHIERAITILNAGDTAGSQAEWHIYETGWFDVEDSVKATSRDAYHAIEDVMGDVRIAFATRPFDPAKAAAALKHLDQVDEQYLSGGFSGTGGGHQPNATLADAVQHLTVAAAKLDQHDPAGASAEVHAFHQMWPAVEGQVKIKAPAAYTSTENDLAFVEAALASTPPDQASAIPTLQRLKATLVPLAEAGTRYGPWDAAFILLREGLEALLVMTALLAFLKKSGNAEKGRWIWIGGGAGIAASVLVAVLVQTFFARSAAGLGREVLEGVTALIAGLMLLYMSWWLHSKANLAKWNFYIRRESTRALATGRMLSLALLAFLAVFREGAETLLFYIGMAPGIATGDLLSGLAMGVAALAAIGVAILGFGMRLPLRPFFLVASLLVYYLAFKFVGTGVHALQVAGVLPATPSPHLPSLNWLGMFPTWQTTLPQLVLVGIAAMILLGPTLRGQSKPPEHSSA